MNIPNSITVTTKEYVEIVTKINLYIAKYGCDWVHHYINNIPLRYRKVEGRNAGAYIVAKVCQEYKVTEYDLFNTRKQGEIMEAKQMLCVLAARHLNLNHKEIASYFNRTRHFVERSIKTMEMKVSDNLPFDKRTLARYRKLDALVGAYLAFVPKNRKL